MLTSLYYYGYYKPYIVNDIKRGNNKNTRISSYKQAIAEKNRTENSNTDLFSYYLNNAYKKEVVNYAADISSKYNGLKFDSQYILNKINSYDYEDEFSDNKNSLKSGFKRFTDRYNQYLDFSTDNEQTSVFLNEYTENINYRLDSNMDSLNSFGISKDENGYLHFDENYFDSLDEKSFIQNENGIKNFCEQVYNDTCDAMSIPMAEHMNFKKLEYYYNYIYSDKNYNPFKIIETGLLVDISV